MTNNPDEIRGTIRQTQHELSADVDALSDKLNPSRMVERRMQRTRSMVTNAREKIMGSSASGMSRDTASAVTDRAGSAAGTAVDAARSAPDAARQRTEGNPLAAGLIAFGAGWLLSSLLPASRPEQQVAGRIKDTAAQHAEPVKQQLTHAAQEAKEQLAEPARQAAESVKTSATDAASTVRDESQAAAGDVAERTQRAKDAVTDRSST